MVNQATIGKVKKDGSALPMWLTTNHKGAGSESLLRNAIDNGNVVTPGLYVVSWTNGMGVPKFRLFTVYQRDGQLVFKPGVEEPHPKRIHRWPPS